VTSSARPDRAVGFRPAFPVRTPHPCPSPSRRGVLRSRFARQNPRRLLPRGSESQARSQGERGVRRRRLSPPCRMSMSKCRSGWAAAIRTPRAVLFRAFVVCSCPAGPGCLPRTTKPLRGGRSNSQRWVAPLRSYAPSSLRSSFATDTALPPGRTTPRDSPLGRAGRVENTTGLKRGDISGRYAPAGAVAACPSKARPRPSDQSIGRFSTSATMTSSGRKPAATAPSQIAR
jgi:hypothetical protein